MLHRLDRRALAQDRSAIVLAATAAALGAFFAATRPLTHWEMDEMLFRLGVESFEPLRHHPHPPGYPLLVGLGKLGASVTGDPFSGLVLLAVLSTVVSFVAFALAVSHIAKDRWIGLAASTLFHLSPAMMVHAPAPMSDPPALMFASLALLCAALPRRSAWTAAAAGAFAAASVGCRPQYALAILPFLLVVLLRDRRLDRALPLLGAFTIVCIGWLMPLVIETGGIAEMVAWQRAQAGWVAQNDAALARRGYSWEALTFRFVAHPWGSKFTAGPVLAFAALGFATAVASRLTSMLPLAALSGSHLLMAIAVYDPADGVRYALPGHYLIAALAALGLTQIARAVRLPVAAPALVAAFVGAAWIYVDPFVTLRRSEPSPPAQAAAWARRHLDPDTVILYDRSMFPHARVLFAPFDIRPSDGPDADASPVHPSSPVYALGEGANPQGDPVVFSWPASDAYGKLTRNHYRVVSLTPLEAPAIPIRGVGPWESADGGPRWRWLADEALFDVPPGAPRGTLVLALPHDAPHAGTEVAIHADDRLLETVTVTRGGSREVALDLPPGRFHLRITAAPHYTIPGDRRRFGVQMLDFDREKAPFAEPIPALAGHAAR